MTYPDWLLFFLFRSPRIPSDVQAGRGPKHSTEVWTWLRRLASIMPWRTQPDDDKGNATQLLVPDLEGTYTGRQPHEESHLPVYHQLSPARELDCPFTSRLTVGCDPTSLPICLEILKQAKFTCP